MKKILRMTIPAFIAAMLSQPAYADNMGVENAIKNNPDLSSFYHALVNTGVNHELDANKSYTIFAPTNAAFARIRQDQYPCFYTSDCRAQVAMIVRNHIIPGDVYMDDAAKQHGGVYSISQRFVPIGEPSRNDYAIAGHNVIYSSATGSNMLYKIDGVIANPKEMASIEYMDYASADQPRTVTRTTRKTIPDPSCGPGGCADETIQTTYVTRTVDTPVLAPAR